MPGINDQEKIEALLEEYEEHRAFIKDMIHQLEGMKAKIDRLIPERATDRYMRLFEEKVKALTGLFNTLLDMRKEIAKSVKDEIELRRKLTLKSGEFDDEDISKFIREAARQMESHRSKKQESVDLQQRLIEATKQGINIPGMSEETKEGEA